ncbi:hypothetical protein RHECNPAF_12210072 [Rhizobium etli CNPAF512]|nr:hypothetical protein RHECNPAF_12210072 [Rhizobium etli CNPAF512]
MWLARRSTILIGPTLLFRARQVAVHTIGEHPQEPRQVVEVLGAPVAEKFECEPFARLIHGIGGRLAKGVITASRTRRSAALGRRSTRPSSSSRATCLLTVV